MTEPDSRLLVSWRSWCLGGASLSPSSRQAAQEGHAGRHVGQAVVARLALDGQPAAVLDLLQHGSGTASSRCRRGPAALPGRRGWRRRGGRPWRRRGRRGGSGRGRTRRGRSRASAGWRGRGWRRASRCRSATGRRSAPRRIPGPFPGPGWRRCGRRGPPGPSAIRSAAGRAPSSLSPGTRPASTTTTRGPRS